VINLRKDLLFFSIIVLFALAVSLLAFFTSYHNPFNLSVRLFALNGFIALSIAAIMTPFLKEITLLLKRPFLRIHHYFAAAGLVLITLHPIALATQLTNPAVFLPNLSSFHLFLLYGGRQALIIIYIALIAVLLRRKAIAYWRPFHALMYLALFFGVVHANLSGTDFLQNTFITFTFNILFAVAIAAFALKRWQFHKIKARKKKA